MSLYVYRLHVSFWPTDDGEPWARYYGDGAAAPHHWMPEWLGKLSAAAAPLQYRYNDKTPLARVAARLKINDGDEVVGVIMPKINRRHYLSASGAHELARDMRAFGAVVTIQRSAAVAEWADLPERH